MIINRLLTPLAFIIIAVASYYRIKDGEVHVTLVLLSIPSVLFLIYIIPIELNLAKKALINKAIAYNIKKREIK